MNNNKQSASGCGTTLVIIVVIIIVSFILVSLGENSGSHSSSKETCQSCDRSFSDATNKNYIRHTNMCKNCYLNFCWATGRTPSNYDR